MGKRPDIKLLISKLLVSFGLVCFAGQHVLAVRRYQASPFRAYVNGEDVYHALTLTVIALALLLPLLFLLWSRLHGTGRGIRMAAYVGMAVFCAPFIAAHFAQKTVGADGVFETYWAVSDPVATASVVIPLILGTLLSIKYKKSGPSKT